MISLKTIGSSRLKSRECLWSCLWCGFLKGCFIICCCDVLKRCLCCVIGCVGLGVLLSFSSLTRRRFDARVASRLRVSFFVFLVVLY